MSVLEWVAVAIGGLIVLAVLIPVVAGVISGTGKAWREVMQHEHEWTLRPDDNDECTGCPAIRLWPSGVILPSAPENRTETADSDSGQRQYLGANGHDHGEGINCGEWCPAWRPIP